jgi:2-polyprenyl-6-methoxyphenol hydroxylase-like FAD-dependent oxidoreductase
MRVLICGAGIAGAAAAWWLERDGHQVTLVERSRERREGGYMVDVREAGLDAVGRMGLLAALRRRAVTLRELVYHDVDGGVLERFVDDSADADRTLSLMRQDLERELHEALGARVAVRFGTTVDVVEERREDVRVALSDGTSETVDLLIGADGLHSRIRRLCFGPEKAFVRDLGFQTAAYVLDDAELAAELGDGLHMIEAPGRQVSAYPRAEQVAATFTHRTPMGSPLPDDIPAELDRLYGGLGGIVPRLLAARPGADGIYCDRVAQVEMPRWTTGRVALIGDACHAMSLLTGQGTSMALAGAEALARSLRENREVTDALAEYDRTRRPTTTRAQREGREFAADFIPR